MYHLYIEDNLQHFSAAQIESLIATFPPQRREVAMRFTHEQGRKECVLSYLLLYKGLQEHYNIQEMPDFRYGEHGKPALALHPELHFNLSHCRQAVVCALSDQPIGVDVERIGRGNDRIIRYTMNEAEQQEIASSDNPSVAFTRLWTQKEAVCKLLGTGINRDIRQLLVQHTDIHLDTVVKEAKGYVYSIALKQKGVPATVIADSLGLSLDFVESL